MGVTKRILAEGGSGGGRGHSAMEHWMKTAEIKNAARVVRRKINHDSVSEGLAEFFGSAQDTFDGLNGGLVSDDSPEADANFKLPRE